MNIQWI